VSSKRLDGDDVIADVSKYADKKYSCDIMMASAETDTGDIVRGDKKKTRSELFKFQNAINKKSFHDESIDGWNSGKTMHAIHFFPFDDDESKWQHVMDIAELNKKRRTVPPIFKNSVVYGVDFKKYFGWYAPWAANVWAQMFIPRGGKTSGRASRKRNHLMKSRTFRACADLFGETFGLFHTKSIGHYQELFKKVETFLKNHGPNLCEMLATGSLLRKGKHGSLKCRKAALAEFFNIDNEGDPLKSYLWWTKGLRTTSSCPFMETSEYDTADDSAMMVTKLNDEGLPDGPDAPYPLYGKHLFCWEVKNETKKYFSGKLDDALSQGRLDDVGSEKQFYESGLVYQSMTTGASSESKFPAQVYLEVRVKSDGDEESFRRRISDLESNGWVRDVDDPSKFTKLKDISVRPNKLTDSMHADLHELYEVARGTEYSVFGTIDKSEQGKVRPVVKIYFSGFMSEIFPNVIYNKIMHGERNCPLYGNPTACYEDGARLMPKSDLFFEKLRHYREKLPNASFMEVEARAKRDAEPEACWSCPLDQSNFDQNKTKHVAYPVFEGILESFRDAQHRFPEGEEMMVVWNRLYHQWLYADDRPGCEEDWIRTWKGDETCGDAKIPHVRNKKIEGVKCYPLLSSMPSGSRFTADFDSLWNRVTFHVAARIASVITGNSTLRLYCYQGDDGLFRATSLQTIFSVIESIKLVGANVNPAKFWVRLTADEFLRKGIFPISPGSRIFPEDMFKAVQPRVVVTTYPSSVKTYPGLGPLQGLVNLEEDRTSSVVGALASIASRFWCDFVHFIDASITTAQFWVNRRVRKSRDRIISWMCTPAPDGMGIEKEHLERYGIRWNHRPTRFRPTQRSRSVKIGRVDGNGRDWPGIGEAVRLIEGVTGKCDGFDVREYIEGKIGSMIDAQTGSWVTTPGVFEDADVVPERKPLVSSNDSSEWRKPVLPIWKNPVNFVGTEPIVKSAELNDYSEEYLSQVMEPEGLENYRYMKNILSAGMLKKWFVDRLPIGAGTSLFVGAGQRGKVWSGIFWGSLHMAAISGKRNLGSSYLRGLSAGTAKVCDVATFATSSILFLD
jgi:hypothetical protein